jgi:inner membrane protein
VIIPFDFAYLIAGSTILLIGLYAKSFQSWKSAGIFSSVLTLLYGFIFIVIRLEDTALLVEALVFHYSSVSICRPAEKVNWYGRTSLEV